MKKTFLLIFLSLSGLYFSQQIHVRYVRVLSPFAITHEDLYIKNNQVISVQDSVIIKNKLDSQWEMGIDIDQGRKPSKNYFVSDLTNEKERNFFFTSNVESRDFFIFDNVPKPDWKIEEKQMKIIAGYKCYKATAMFRGSKVIAYFANDLSYSTGPFKFYGLPGIILDIRVENLDSEIWKAESVSIDDKKDIVYKPKFLNKEKISLKEYVDIKEAYMNKVFAKTDAAILKAAPNAKIETKQRFTVEQKYEWEEQK